MNLYYPVIRWTPSIKRSLTKVLEIISLNYSTTDLYIEWSPLLRGCSYFSKVATSSFLLSARLLTFTFSRSIPLYKARVTNQTNMESGRLQSPLTLSLSFELFKKYNNNVAKYLEDFSRGSDGNQFKVHIIYS